MSAVEPLPYQPFGVTELLARGQVMIVPEGELDRSTVDQLGREVSEPRGAGFDRIVVDLRDLYIPLADLATPLRDSEAGALTGFPPFPDAGGGTRTPDTRIMIPLL